MFVLLTLFTGCLAAQSGSRQGTIETPITAQAEIGKAEIATSQPIEIEGDDAAVNQPGQFGAVNVSWQTLAGGGVMLWMFYTLLRDWIEARDRRAERQVLMQIIERLSSQS